MRHRRLGYPLRGMPPVAGRPCTYWLGLFALSHQETAHGWQRLAWPDGGPLLAQPWPQAMAFAVIREELERLGAEQARRASAGGPAPGRR